LCDVPPLPPTIFILVRAFVTNFFFPPLVIFSAFFGSCNKIPSSFHSLARCNLNMSPPWVGCYNLLDFRFLSASPFSCFYGINRLPKVFCFFLSPLLLWCRCRAEQLVPNCPSRHSRPGPFLPLSHPLAMLRHVLILTSFSGWSSFFPFFCFSFLSCLFSFFFPQFCYSTAAYDSPLFSVCLFFPVSIRCGSASFFYPLNRLGLFFFPLRGDGGCLPFFALGLSRRLLISFSMPHSLRLCFLTLSLLSLLFLRTNPSPLSAWGPFRPFRNSPGRFFSPFRLVFFSPLS